MDNLIYILFICVVAPLFLMLFMLKKRSKMIIGFMLIGIFVSLFVSELNTIILNFFNNDTLLVTTSLTPITEELFKAVPILFYALVYSDRQDRVLPLAMSVGIGFGMFENMVILLQNIEEVTIAWAIIRGFSTALMHGVCTLTVGFGICFVRKKRKLFYCGTFSLLVLASIYHGIFNMLVQSDYKYFGFILPAVTYIPIIINQCKDLVKKSSKETANEKG
jgi:RsiW-degrading membrane proteinase PrsW (M82 family)